MTNKAQRSVQKLEDEIAELERLSNGDAPEEDTTEEEIEEVIEESSEEVEEEEGVTEPLTKEEETFKKRYSDLRRHNQKVADELKEANEALAALKKQKATAGLPSAEEAESWAKENPKAAAIIRALALEQTSANTEELSAVKDKLNRAEQKARILEVHPDFEKVTGDDKFHDWADEQPESVQALIFSKSADDVIWALTQFKKEHMSVKPNDKKDAAKLVSSKSTSAEPKTQSKGRFTESQVSKMSMQEYETNEAAINKSISDGTFVYDLSGAAR